MSEFINSFGVHFLSTYAYLIGMICVAILMMIVGAVASQRRREGHPIHHLKAGFTLGGVVMVACLILFMYQRIEWQKTEDERQRNLQATASAHLQAIELQQQQKRAIEQGKFKVLSNTGQQPQAPSSFEIKTIQPSQQTPP